MPKPPTPRGYQRLEMAVRGSNVNFVAVLSCLKCGALVLMSGTHDTWHKKNDR